MRDPQELVVCPGATSKWDMSLLVSVIKNMPGLDATLKGKVTAVQKLRNDTYGHVPEASISDAKIEESLIPIIALLGVPAFDSAVEAAVLKMTELGRSGDIADAYREPWKKEM
jgi:hypothetical protein